MAGNEAAQALRDAADCVEACALSDAQLDLIEMIALHVKDKATGGITDRCRTTKLLLRMLDR